MLLYSEFKIIVLFMQFQKFSFFFYDYVIVHQGAVVYISRKPMICASTKPWHIVFFSQNCTSLVLRFKVKVKKLNILKILFLSFSFLLVSLVHLWWLSWMGKYGLVLVWTISIIFFIIIILNSNDGNVTVLYSNHIWISLMITVSYYKTIRGKDCSINIIMQTKNIERIMKTNPKSSPIYCACSALLSSLW